MNKRLFRTQFNQMENIEKQVLMESLAARYDMTFLGLHTFDRWGQSCTTGIFKKDGREFVFVPGDTVTLGWEQFAVGLNQESREELEYLFREWEMERDPEEMIRESMAPVRQAAIGPMLVGRELEEINWEPVKMDDPRLTVHPDWLKEFRDFAWSGSSSLTLHQSARIERTEKGFQICIYNHTDYDALLAMLENRGFSLPTADEWAYLCGGGWRTLFPWGDGLDYMLVERKKEIDELMDLFGDEYIDNNLVFCSSNGRPMESQVINRAFNKLIKENGLPHVVFHSLRHSSITYKLKLNGGDMKSVQGDSGHAQVKMVADVYSHIIDEDRCINAQRLEEAFYSSKTPDPVEDTEPETADTAVTESDESDAAKILELLKNPETAALLKQLAKAL